MEALRALRKARRSAIAARAEALVQLKALVITALEPLRSQLRELSTRHLLDTCGVLCPDPARIADPTHATKTALRTLARRRATLTEETDDLDDLVGPPVEEINPDIILA